MSWNITVVDSQVVLALSVEEQTANVNRIAAQAAAALAVESKDEAVSSAAASLASKVIAETKAAEAVASAEASEVSNQAALVSKNAASVSAASALADADRAELAVSMGVPNGGPISAASSPVAGTTNRVYFPTASGTYTNFSGLVVDITTGLNIILGNSTSGFQKIVVPLSLLAYALKTEALGFSVSKNLFNKLSITSGFFVNWTTGNLGAVVGRSSSGFIPVSPSTSYYISGANFGIGSLAYYNSSNVFISGTQSPSNLITTPANTAFIRVSVFDVDLNTYQLELGSSATAFAEFAPTINKDFLKIKSTQLPDNLVTTSSIIGASQAGFLEKTKNLLNKNAITPNFLVNWNNGNLLVSADRGVSEYIPITASTSYIISGAIFGIGSLAFYNTAKVFISGSQSPSASITSPANSAFIRVSVFNVDADTYQLQQGTVPTTYESFGYKFTNEIVEVSDSAPIQTVPFAILGDSLTAQNQWQPFVSSRIRSDLFLSITSLGTGGTRISGAGSTAFCQDVRINAIPISSEVVAVFGGTNDWAQDVALGTDTSLDTNTFKGAINVVINKLLARSISYRIFFITPPYQELPDFVPRGWSNAYQNSLGLTTNDYAQAIKDVCKKRNIPVSDVNQATGWNEINISYFMIDDGGLLHPNAFGGKRIGYEVASLLNKML